MLFSKTWLPDDSPRAIVVIVHGVGEHIDRYKNLVDALVPAGYMVTGYNQRGHGHSQGKRGHINSWDEYRGDLRIFLDEVKKLEPEVPIFLYGHSMGSLVVLDYVLHDSKGLAGAIISGTALEPAGVAPPFLMWLARRLSGIVPGFTIKLKLKGSDLSRDPIVAKAYMEDPLVYWERTFRWGAESLRIVEWIKSRAGEINLPVLFIHGEADPLNLPSGAQSFYEQVQYPDKTLIVYPGGVHEPHNDLDFPRVTSDIEQWIARHIG